MQCRKIFQHRNSNFKSSNHNSEAQRLRNLDFKLKKKTKIQPLSSKWRVSAHFAICAPIVCIFNVYQWIFNFFRFFSVSVIFGVYLCNLQKMYLYLVIALSLLVVADGLYFHIAETEKKCFIEEIPDETMVCN